MVAPELLDRPQGLLLAGGWNFTHHDWCQPVLAGGGGV